jgi:WD40 repeat protein
LGLEDIIIRYAMWPTVQTASWDHSVKVWDAVIGREIVTFTGHLAQVLAVAFSPDGKHLASVGDDRIVRIWNVDDAREILAFSGHTGNIRSVAFSPDGTLLASSGEDKTIRIWKVRD